MPKTENNVELDLAAERGKRAGNHIAKPSVLRTNMGTSGRT